LKSVTFSGRDYRLNLVNKGIVIEKRISTILYSLFR